MKHSIPKSAQDVVGRQAAPQEHPSADLLNGFVEQALSGAEKEQVTTHLAACAECREVVFLAGGDEEAPLPAMHRPLPVASSRWTFWSWKWVVPSVAAVAIAVGVTLMRERSGQPQPAASPTTSMNAPSVAPQARMDETLTYKAAPEARRDVASESKPVGQKKQEVVAESQSPAALAKGKDTSSTAAELGQLKAYARDEKQSVQQRAPYSFAAAGAAQPAAPAVVIKNDAPRLAAKSLPSAGPPPPQRPAAAKPQSASPRDSIAIGGSLPDAFYSSAAAAPASQSKNEAQTVAANSASTALPPSRTEDSSANVLHKSKAAESAAGPSEVAAARQNQQAVQQQQMTVDSASGAGSLIEGTPVSVRFSDWRITGDGHLERGSSSGEWTRVLSDQPVHFQTVAQVGNEVWAGADDGVLFHSSDGGERWTEVRVSKDEHRPIVSIRFRDALEGTISTDLNTTWKTADGGKSWIKE
jgi:putative zinc finger protein